MKYLTLVACVTLLTLVQTPTASAAMAKCTLTREQSPEIRGVRLGMTTDQLLSRFPDVDNRERINAAIAQSQRPENYGAASFELYADKEKANPRLAGINFISISLIDQRVIRFNVTYQGPEWKTVDQFVAKLNEGLRLPSSAWDPGGETSQHMSCDGFSVNASTSRGSTVSSVWVQDTSAPQVVEDRREAAREKVRQAFRP
jgi:hypothetical protein